MRRRSPMHLAALAFIDKVLAETGGEGCRLWPFRTNYGYGLVYDSGHDRLVTHVVMRRLGRTRPSPSHEVCHSCDVRACIAPWHLRWGTRTENMADMRARGRSQAGERHHNSKLTDSLVLDMRARWSLGEPIEMLAETAGVKPTAVLRAVTGQTWRHLPLIQDRDAGAHCQDRPNNRKANP